MALCITGCANSETKKDATEKRSAKVENRKKSVNKSTKSTSKKKLLMPNASGLP